jgi:hypothetical protein
MCCRAGALLVADMQSHVKPCERLRFPDNLMSSIHIRNAWGISFLVSLLLKDVGEE